MAGYMEPAKGQTTPDATGAIQLDGQTLDVVIYNLLKGLEKNFPFHQFSLLNTILTKLASYHLSPTISCHISGSQTTPGPTELVLTVDSSSNVWFPI